MKVKKLIEKKLIEILEIAGSKPDLYSNAEAYREIVSQIAKKIIEIEKIIETGESI